MNHWDIFFSSSIPSQSSSNIVSAISFHLIIVIFFLANGNEKSIATANCVVCFVIEAKNECLFERGKINTQKAILIHFRFWFSFPFEGKKIFGSAVFPCHEVMFTLIKKERLLFFASYVRHYDRRDLRFVPSSREE
jgi:hypothetical protein